MADGNRPTPNQLLREILWKITGRPRRRMFMANATVNTIEPDPPSASEPFVAHCTTDSPDALHYVFLVKAPIFGSCSVIQHYSDLVPGTANFDVNFDPVGTWGSHVVRVWAIDECGVPGEESSISFSAGARFEQVEYLTKLIQGLQDGK